MHREKIIFIFFAFFMPLWSYGQVFPNEGSVLNYRIVGFSFPLNKKASGYRIEIAAGNFNSEVSFTKNVIKTLHADTNRVIGEVPAFGKQYTWRISYVNRNAVSKDSVFHHFSTGTSRYVDSSRARLRILKKAERHKDAYVFLDQQRVLCDMNGNAVWYMPGTETTGEEFIVRDLKLSNSGTITYLAGNVTAQQAFEINYYGDILWQGPNNGSVSGDKTENYHHEFTRLKNGHYMVLGNEFGKVYVQATGDGHGQVLLEKEAVDKPGAVLISPYMPFGILIEYDQRGNLVWKWRSADYFKESDLFFFMSRKGAQSPDPHDNSFFFDSGKNTIYISFKNINRIVKISYPDGKVLNVYGETYEPGIRSQSTGMFSSQHACKVSQDGFLYLFNNNDRKFPEPPSVVMMREPVSKKDTLQKVWEYFCSTDMTDDKLNGEQPAQVSSSGGNVIELADRSFFVSVANTYGLAPFAHVFIVDRNKRLLWSAKPEKWNDIDKKWVPDPLYRASIVTQDELKQLIWSRETTDK
jgi:hypothetical protein